ncbi:MAG TPA: HAMP domain-containing sensor histidine kinase [Thermoanaerobaculia bacterium]|jgi:signal transduction histidine kinase|nr:HAMP domain-containing sensor histidine kinase [Thermoanaerobaculia bacterium]
MKRASLPAVLVVIALATGLFYLLIHEVSRTWLSIGLRPEVRESISRSLDDQKTLRTLDPAKREIYRRRFEDEQKLLNRIDILTLSREAVRRRIEVIIITIFAATLLAVAMIWSFRQRAAEQRERSEFAARLSSFQQAARRHAHEIRTPLAAARLEVDRLLSLVDANRDVERVSASVFEELDRLARFTRDFTSFATVGQPVLRTEQLDRAMTEFCETFASAWSNLELRFSPPAAPISVQLDLDLFRQVLANLCANSSRATNGSGSVTFTIARDGSEVLLDVTDAAGGVPESIRPHLFDPYVTTQPIGEGMGLGLAISRKILLDHGGDLVLASTSAAGTTFRITLPAS